MDQSITATLTHLITICKFRCLALQKAAAHMKVPIAAQFLQDHAQESQTFADEIQHLLLSVGVEPDASTPEDVHIPEINDRTYRGIIQWCQRQENQVCNAYSAALSKPLPDAVHSVIRSHLSRIMGSNAMLFESI